MKAIRLPPAGAEPDHRMPIELFYEDTDLSGVVYHANYLKFLERVRTRWIRTLGVDQQALAERQGLAFTVADLSIRYLRPLRLEDACEATLTVLERRPAQLLLYQSLRDGADPSRVHAHANVRIACVELRRFRPVALPDLLPDFLSLADTRSR